MWPPKEEETDKDSNSKITKSETITQDPNLEILQANDNKNNYNDDAKGINFHYQARRCPKQCYPSDEAYEQQ